MILLIFSGKITWIREILVSVKFVSAILGPEMGAPILWTPGKNEFFLQENPMSIKFLVLGGGVFWVFWGGGSADFIFMGARIFLNGPGGGRKKMKKNNFPDFRPRA